MFYLLLRLQFAGPARSPVGWALNSPIQTHDIATDYNPVSPTFSRADYQAQLTRPRRAMSADKSSGSSASLAFTLVAEDHQDTLHSTQDLRAALEKGTDELKLDTLRRIIISTLNGQPQVSLTTRQPQAEARAGTGTGGGPCLSIGARS